MKTVAKLSLAVAAFSMLGAVHASAFEKNGYKVPKQPQAFSMKLKVKGHHKPHWKRGKKRPASRFWKGDGVRIGGRVENQTTVKENKNIAKGKRARAIQSIGTIHGTGDLKIRGSVKNTTYVERNLNLARGSDAVACQSIGSIGDNPAC